MIYTNTRFSRVPVLTLVAMVLFIGVASGQSIFSREGVGEWYEGYDLRGESLGGTGIGTIDPFNFSGPNPAATAFSPHTLVYMAARASRNDVEDVQGGSSRLTTGRISGLGVHVPLDKKWGLGFSVRPQTDGVYTFSEVIPVDGVISGDNIHREEGSRGLLHACGDVTFRALPNLAMGMRVGVQGGSLLNEEYFEFAGELGSSRNQRTLRFHPSLTLGGGFQWSPFSRFGLGGTFSLPSNMTVDETFRGPAGTEWDRESEMKFPAGFGGGASFYVNRRLRLSGDFYMRNWEDFELAQESLPADHNTQFQNTLRWGVGLERLPRTGLNVTSLDRIAYRVGFAWTPWYVLDATGDEIMEQRVTAGIGIPFRKDRGRLDFLMSWIKRGSLEDNGIDENGFQIGFACTFARVVREY
jgi:hypothetical protein